MWMQGCKSDDFVPCTDVGSPELMCKKIVIADGKPAGIVRYAYTNSNRIAAEFFSSAEDKLQTSRKYYYSNGNLDSTETFDKADNITSKEVWLFSDTNKLIWNIKTLSNNEIDKTLYQYSKNLDSTIFYVNDSYKGYQRIIYQNESATVHKRVDYNNANEITRFAITDTFENGYKTEMLYNGKYQKIGQNTHIYATSGKISSISEYGLNNVLVSKTTYDYDPHERLIKKQIVTTSTSLDNYELYYYP